MTKTPDPKPRERELARAFLRHFNDAWTDQREIGEDHVAQLLADYRRELLGPTCVKPTEVFTLGTPMTPELKASIRRILDEEEQT